MEKKSKKVGKVGYFNSLTGYIIYNDEMIPFHIKDCYHFLVGKELINQMVEFDIEENKFGLVARNVEFKEKIEDDSFKDGIKINYKN